MKTTLKRALRRLSFALLALPTAALAQDNIAVDKPFWLRLEEGVLGFVVYSLLGGLMMIAVFKLVDAFLPGKLAEQLVEDKNVSLGVFLGCVMLGIAIIIAAAIAG